MLLFAQYPFLKCVPWLIINQHQTGTKYICMQPNHLSDNLLKSKVNMCNINNETKKAITLAIHNFKWSCSHFLRISQVHFELKQRNECLKTKQNISNVNNKQKQHIVRVYFSESKHFMNMQILLRVFHHR